MYVEHIFEPVYDQECRILILGTFPSVKSRENQFYYGHPQNRFWKVIAALTQEKGAAPEVPVSIQQKKELLLSHHIAIWDVIASCDITGSSDSSIKNVTPTDLSEIFRMAPIGQVYANGGTAARLYHKYQEKQTQREIMTLPSTSPANAAYSLERLLESWRCIMTNIKE